MKAIIRLLLLLFFIGLGSGMVPVGAAAPYGWVTRDGRPFTWNNSQPIPFSIDQGPLGRLTGAGASAHVQAAFQRWDEVDTAAISFAPAPPLTEDITGANVMAFLDNLPQGGISVIFDNDGSVIRELLGEATAAIALGRPVSSDPATGAITAGYVVLNGLYIDGRFNPDDLTESDFRGRVIAAIGHALGIGNSQLNQGLILDGIPENNSLIPHMDPRLAPGKGDQLTLDDRAALTALYPNPALAVTIGSIRGVVLLPDGATGLQGVNVVARRVGDPNVTAVSAISGVLFKNEVGPPPADGSRQVALRGAFEITGLPPGAYLLSVEALQPGAMAGPLDPPAFLPGGMQYYRAGQVATNDPDAASPITIEPGQVVENANLVLNVPAGPPVQNLNEQEPNQFPEQAQALPLAVRVQGSIQANDSGGVNVPLQDGATAAVQDLYRLTLTGPTLLTVTLSAADPNSDLNLFLLSGPVATAPRVSAISLDAGTPPESFQLRVQSGIYYLAVSHAAGPATSYILEVNGTAAPDVTTPAPQRPRLNNLAVVNVTPINAGVSFQSDLPSNTLLYVSNPLTEFGNPALTTEHRQSLTNLAPGTAYRLQTMAVTEQLGIGRLPDVFFTTALPALTGGVGQVSAGVTDIIEDPDDPDAAYVVLSLRNVGTGDASNVTINQLTAPDGWAFSDPLPSPLGLGFLGRGGSGVILTRLVKTAPTDSAPIIRGTGTYFSPGVGTQPFTFGGAVSFLTVQKSVTPGTAQPGVAVTYTLTAINSGQGPATGVLLTDALPANLQFLNATAGGQFQNGNVIWNLGSLAANGSVTVSFNARVLPNIASGTTITNVALIRSNETPTPLASNVVPLDVTAPPPQLQITKTANRTSAGPGEVITYTLGFANAGGTRATNVQMTDSLPAGTVFVNATGEYSISGGVVTWTIGSLAPNANGSRELLVQVATGMAGGTVIQNTAQIAAAEAPAAVTSAPVAVTVAAPPQLRVDKTASLNSVRVGDSLTYTLSVANSGGGAATNVRLFDQVPVNTTYVSSQGGSLQGGQVVWNLGTLNAGGRVTVSFTVQIQQAAATAAVINNIALVTSNEIPNGVASNNVAVGVVAPPQFQLTKSVNPTQARPGDVVTYTIVAGNVGQGAATNVQVFDDVQLHTTFVSASSGGGFVDANTIAWNLGTLAPGASATLTLQVRIEPTAPNGAAIQNLAAMRSTELPNLFPSNGGAPTVLTVVAPPPPPQLRLTKTADTQNPAPGATISYTLSFQNLGSGSATGAQLVEEIPAGTQLVEALGAGISGNSVVWNLGTLGAGASGARTLRVRVLNTTPSNTSISNTAHISAQGVQPVASNTVTVVVSVPAVPRLQIQKTVNVSQAAPGAELNYQISFFNTGTSAATSVSIQDQLPANTTFVSATGGGAPFGNTVFWNVPTLQAGQQGVVTLRVQINQGTPNGTQISNSARISSSQTSVVVSNLVTTTVVAPQPPQLTVLKTADVTTVQPSGLINYTITVRNAGGGAATNVMVSDTIPQGTTGVFAFDGGVIQFGVASWSLGTLQTGEQRQVRLRVQVNTNATGTVSNSAQARSNETPTPISSDVIQIPIQVPLNVTIQKTVDRASATPGTELRYDISFRNNSNVTITGARITDTLPSGTQFLQSPQAVSAQGPTLVWFLAPLAAGQQGSVSFNVRINQTAQIGSQIVNRATFSVPDQQFSVESDPVVTTVEAAPLELTIQKTVDVQQAEPGDQLNYTIRYTNNGSTTVNNLVVRDPIPANLQVLAATQGFNLQGNVLVWNVSALGAGQQGAVAFRARINPGTQPGTQITNQATLQVPSRGFVLNSNQVTTAVSAAPIELTIQKTVDQQQAAPGDNLQYTITFANTGDSTVNGAVVRDQIPANVQLVNAPGAGQQGNTLVWNLNAIGASQGGQVSFTVRINQGVANGTQIANQATIQVPAQGFNLNSNQVVTTVQAQPVMLTLEKAVDMQQAPPGTTLTYTLRYTNNGQQPLNGLQIVDSVPANTQFVGADNNGQATGGVVRWNIPALAAGGFNSVSFQVRINQGAAAGTVISNQAQIGGPTVPQPVQSNTVNTTVTPPQQINLTLLKEVNKPQAPPNDTLTYTLGYANNGTQTFNQLVLVDTLPAGTNFESATDGGQSVGRDVRWNLPSLPPGANGRVRFTLRIANGYPIGQVISNVARITGPGLPGDVQSNSANTTVGPVLTPELTVTKQVNTPQAAPGAELTYSITYVNTGQQTANGLELEDPLPANTEFVSADNGGQLDGNTVRWNLPPATPGNGGSVGLRVRVSVRTQAGTVIRNQARIVGPTVPQPIESNFATTTITDGQPASPFVGTWFGVGTAPTDHTVALTVDRQNRFTVWAVSRDRVLINRSAQGQLSADGSFNVFSSDQAVQFIGEIAPNGQSAQVTARRAGLAQFTLTVPRLPDVGPLPDRLTGTWNGVGQANGDQLEVHLSIDPQGNATFAGAVTQPGGTVRRQFATFYVTPDGRITDPNGNRQVGLLQQQGNQFVLTYSFQHAGPPAYQRDFQVVLQPLQ